MPVELYPGDRYHALVSVMPRYRGGNGGVAAGHAEAPALRQVPTTKSALLVMWNTEHLIGRVASEYELQWSTEHPKDLLVNVSGTVEARACEFGWKVAAHELVSRWDDSDLACATQLHLQHCLRDHESLDHATAASVDSRHGTHYVGSQRPRCGREHDGERLVGHVHHHHQIGAIDMPGALGAHRVRAPRV